MLAAESTRQEPDETGLAPAPGGRLWWRLDGARHLKSTRPALIAVHGGPGGAHDYLEPLTALADERAVLLYDQLDCGNSDKPGDPANWNVARFTDEVEAVRRAAGVERFVLLGHSWGAVVALEYAARGNPHLAGVVFASPLISTPRWCADNLAHRQALPAEVRSVLDRHEAAGTVDSAEYRDAMAVMMGRHFCRLRDEPPEVTRLFRKLNFELYRSLWGDNEFVCAGALKDYDGSTLLPRIAVPALFLCGEFDESTPAANRDFASLVPGAKVSIIPGASHTPMFENPQAFRTALTWFCGDLS